MFSTTLLIHRATHQLKAKGATTLAGLCFNVTTDKLFAVPAKGGDLR
jgi:hypothetical protein